MSLFSEIHELSNKIGRTKTLILLIDRGVGASTAQQLISGTYKASRPTGLLQKALEDVLKEAKKAS